MSPAVKGKQKTQETQLTKNKKGDMSKLSPSLKALINTPSARPGQAPAPKHIRDVYMRIAREAKERKYGVRPWITLSAAATFTLNSPPPPHPARPRLHHPLPLATAELIREIGLKCISFNGIPRTINCLGAFKTGLSHHPWSSHLSTTPSRQLSPVNLPATLDRGRGL
ncbi:hypothetical protein N0V88_005569 [Collariella sp. IMI 366227]|nr:hypothetical protein N0V88_005569 [Collariella sp. IMI 366227]